MDPAQPDTAATPASNEHIYTLVPRLELNGSNWAVFMMRFSEAMDAADRWGHFDGTEPRPEPKDPNAPTDDETAAQKRWDREDKIGRSLLLQFLHDTTALRIRPFPTAQERWTRLSQEFTANSIYAQEELKRAFFGMRCSKGGDVRTYLENLGRKRYELMAAGVPISDGEYTWTILRGIPEDLAQFASPLFASARLSSLPSSVYLDTLIVHICREADRVRDRRNREQQNRGGRKKGKQPALAATT